MASTWIVVADGNGNPTHAECDHLLTIHQVDDVKERVCSECVVMGSRWLHLRQCLQCGHVGCCDDSPNTHATKHYGREAHPIMRSVEPGDDWGWCFEDKLILEQR